ncbi:MAG: hypothetical protein AAFY57_19840 [Cyanobacteria bacterium J06642_2]
MSKIDWKKYYPWVANSAEAAEKSHDTEAIEELGDRAEVAPPVPLYQRGTVKLVFLGGIAGVAILGLYAFLSIASSSTQVREATTVTDHNGELSSGEQNEVVAAETPEDTRYVQGMDEARREIEEFNSPKPTPEAVAEPPPPPEPVPAPPPQTVVTAPAPPPPVVPLVTTAPPKTPAELLEEYAMLGRLGQFGGVSGEVELAAADYSRPPRQPVLPTTELVSSTQPFAVSQAESSPPPERVRIRTTHPSEPPSDFVEPGHVETLIRAGTKAAARVISPIAWFDGNDTDTTQLYTVRLTQPMRNARGAVEFQIGTEILVSVLNVQSNGYMQLQAESAILRTGAGLKEIALEPGSVSVRGGGGNPLIATQAIDRGGDVASQEVGLFLLGAANRASSVFNREQSTVVTNINSTQISTDFEEPNIGAALLQGGTEEILDGVRARNRQAINEMLDGENIWTVAAEVPVEVFVNRSIEL